MSPPGHEQEKNKKNQKTMKRIFPLTAVSLCAIACLTLVAVISCDGNEGILSPNNLKTEHGFR